MDNVNANARIRVVCRMDDAGSCPSANAAIAEILAHGFARNVSVMACATYFDEAAAMLRRFPDACIGLHATIHAEWDEVKWPPVLPPDRAASLVDENGMLLANPMLNHERGVNADEVLAEIAAQLARMRDAGLNVRYMDQHMCFGWLADVGPRLAALARREGLLYDEGALGSLPPAPEDVTGLAERFIAQLEAAGPGDYLYVSHPGRDRPDMRRFTHAGLAPGQVARERDEDRLRYLSPKVMEHAAAHGVAFVTYADVLT